MKSTSTSLEYMRWARDVMPRLVAERALSRSEGLMLKELASRADRRGGCFASAATLGQGIGVGGRQAERLLNGLRAKKLVTVTPRGRGCTRTLQPSAVPDLLTGQLSFDDLLAGTIPEPVQQATAPEPMLAVACAVPPTSAAVPPTSGCRTKEMKVSVEEGDARCARYASASRPGLASLGVDVQPSQVLETHLTAVLQALATAPNLLLEPMNVNAALAAHPEAKGHDHLCAALTLVSLALGEQRATLAHPRLLGILQRQTRGPASTGRSWAAGHEGRARRAAPTAVLTAYDRED
jgi:hypothetical protein